MNTPSNTSEIAQVTSQLSMLITFHFFSLSSVRWNKVPTTENLGNFELLIDEELASQSQDDQGLLNNLTGSKQRVNNNRWK